MADYIKREDALNTIRNTFTGMTADTLELRINDIPSADVAPVRYEEDGTLWVTVGDCGKVGRVIVKNEQGHFCRVFYVGDGDEEPVRHGRWKAYKTDVAGRGFFYCTACHADVYDTSAYCPSCGAKMDCKCSSNK